MKGISLTKVITWICIFSVLFEGNIYALTLPSAIPNGVFHLDAQDINGNGSTLDEPLSGTKISLWWDLFTMSHSGIQSTLAKRPDYLTNQVNGFPIIQFPGTNQILEVLDHTDINLDISYSEKSFAFFFRTDADILSHQIVYEQSIGTKGYALQIDNGNLYFWVWNTEFWSNPDEYKIIDLWAINSNTPYRVIITWGTNMSAYLDGILAGSVSGLGIQTTHGQCIFDMSFGCALYQSGGTIWIGGIQNDTIRLSTLTPISTYQGNFFSGDIGEIIEWNHTLTPTEITGLDEYLRVHWGFDTTPPVITSVNINSGTLIPKGNFTYTVGYTDTGSSIDTGSVDLKIYTWNTGSLSWNTTDISGLYEISASITNNTWSFNLAGMPAGKYRFDRNISDTSWNTHISSSTLFIDALEWTVSTPTYTIGDARSGTDTFGTGELTITVKTVGAGFDLSMIRTNDLTRVTDVIPVYDGTNGWGYTQWNGSLFPPTITAHGATQTLWSVLKNIDQNGNKNTFTYRIKYAINPDTNTPAGDYNGNVSFGLNLIY